MTGLPENVDKMANDLPASSTFEFTYRDTRQRTNETWPYFLVEDQVLHKSWKYLSFHYRISNTNYLQMTWSAPTVWRDKSCKGTNRKDVIHTVYWGRSTSCSIWDWPRLCTSERCTHRVKEAIHPDNINRDTGIEIPEAWIPTVTYFVNSFNEFTN